MNNAPHNKSRFLKADTRADLSEPAFVRYTSDLDPAVAVHDIFLYAGQDILLSKIPGKICLLLPVVSGGIIRIDANEFTISSGQVLHFYEEEVMISNPFEETVNFLILVLEPGENQDREYVTGQLLVEEAGTLIKAEGIPDHVYVGVYNSRTQTVFRLPEPSNAMMAFVINGSFGLEGRQMEFRDGLYLWDVSGIAFESLSDTAVILLVAW